MCFALNFKSIKYPIDIAFTFELRRYEEDMWRRTAIYQIAQNTSLSTFNISMCFASLNKMYSTLHQITLTKTKTKSTEQKLIYLL